MLTLLTCAIALAPSALPQRIVVVTQGGSIEAGVVKKHQGRLVILAQNAAERSQMLAQADEISPYAVQPRRDRWPYSQLPANPKPSDSRSNKARSWLIGK